MIKLILLAAAVAVASAANSYMILAPSSFRPGVPLNVSVNILSAAGTVNVKVDLVNDGTKQVIASAVGHCTQNQPQLLQLVVPDDAPSALYKLHVQGTGHGVHWTNESAITYESKSISIFIQTDKAMYKPGQTVNFRTFAVFPNLTVYTGAMDIDIYDPNSNKIKQMMGLQDPSGVITSLMNMDSQPVLGDWKIRVKAHGRTQEKTFTVAHYVLPKFEVSVELPSYILTSDKSITGKVKATYTYGKPVQGKVHIEVKVDRGYNSLTDPTVVQTLTIDGETSFTISLDHFHTTLRYLNGYTLKVQANVTESLNQITLSGDSTVKFYDHANKMEFVSSNPQTFKPGMKYIGYIKLSQQDGLPVNGLHGNLVIGGTVTLKDPTVTEPPMFFGGHTDSAKLTDHPYTVPDSGIVEFQLDIPANASSISLTATCDNVPTAYVTVSKSYSPSDTYIQLVLKSTQLSAGQMASFDVKGTETISNAIYQVLSRGTVVTTGRFSGNTFSMPITGHMAPNARIVVYYVRADGEVVTDSISFDVDGVFENDVSIDFSASRAQPGETVDVVVTADPMSLVSLLAVDQSVLLLKSGNDVTASEVIDELKTYDTIVHPHSSFCCDFGGPALIGRKKRMAIWWGYPTYYGGSDANQIFTNAGVMVITDALVFHHVEPPMIYPNFEFAGMALAGGGMPGVMAPGPAMNGPTSGLQPVDHSHGFLMGSIDFGPGLLNSMVQRPQTSTPTSLPEPSRVRKVFPETWLWTNTSTGANGRATIHTTVPDTITSWIASAFAVNAQSGLGVSASTAKIETFKQFFVSLNLPYSVVRGEQLALQANVFNYLAQDLDVVVTLQRSSDFKNIVVDSNGAVQYVSQDEVKNVHVPAGQAKSVFFPIVPASLGKFPLTVKAQSVLAADAVQRQLLVEPEGVAKEYNTPILVDLKNSSTFSRTLPLSLPAGVVAGSQRAVVSAIGDLMGPTVNGIDKLLQMPTGCGEQTMLGFAPDVFVTDYLTATNQLSGEIEEKAVKYMESGYQRELTYQHKDGSFSAFGDNDKSGSMWLTAFVVKSFHQAKPYVFIDDEVLVRAIDWMLARQNADGSFPEPGNVIHKDMQGGSASGVGLTAFVLVSLLENSDLTGGIAQRITKARGMALGYLESQVAGVTDDYVLSISSYALQLASSPVAATAFARLEQDAVVKDGMKHWHKAETATTTSHHWQPAHVQSNPIDIEMSSYALLVYAAKKDFSGGMPIMKWITSQRNANGGFASTQDTVLGLQALSDFARMAFSDSFDIQATITAGTFTHTFSINKQNALVLQSVVLPTIPSQVTVSATGHGMALVNIELAFHVEQEIEERSFEVVVTMLKDTADLLTVQTCTKWLKFGASGMAVQEIGIPSGFEADLETLEQFTEIKRIDTDDRKVILYFDQITTAPLCITMDVFRTGFVAKSQPAAVRVYDYYQPSNQITQFYQSHILENTNICDMCLECGCMMPMAGGR